MLWTDKAKKYLKKYWNIDNLKDKQIDVINELLLGNDVIGLLPTGYGKSMCYLIPPIVTNKVMFIISPLISLMDDQKDKLVKMNIPCAALHGNNRNRNTEIEQILDGKIKIVYMSPEYSSNEGLLLAHKLIDKNKMGFVAVDESHCISVWGQDFRPDYIKVKDYRKLFPSIPIIAVTATATETVCDDITKLLCLNNPIIVRASFDRPNLYLKISEIPSVTILEKPKRGTKLKQVQKQIPKEKIILPYLKKYPNEKIIIYAGSRKDTEEISVGLNKLLPNSSNAYHAGLSKDEREEIQHRFVNGEIKVIISTIAFGMGIDQIVKCVIIFGFPSSIEEFYQQIGRGGRDGLPCETILYFDYSKLRIAHWMLRDIKINFPMLYKAKINNLDQVSKFSYLSTCRRKFVLEYFNECCDFFTCDNCDNCCEQELVDMTDLFWPIIMKPNINFINKVIELKTKYIIDVTMLDKKNKEHFVDLNLNNQLNQWNKFITANNIKKENLPEKLKIKIPKKFIKIINENKFDKDQISYYEKLLNL